MSNPHGLKLKALLTNNKLPTPDKCRVGLAISKYNDLIQQLKNLTNDDLLKNMVTLINAYKKHIDFELIFNSTEDFLYRQNGQLKLSNSILEEFIPYFIDSRLIPGIAHAIGIEQGSFASYAGLSFGGAIQPLNSGGIYIKLKDQDFALAKKHTLNIFETALPQNSYSKDFYVSYFAAEIKTNLDKTMFQEASQTANDLKIAVSGSRYLLLCEYLDMTPINTKLTAIDEVIILRRAKRLSSNVRSEFSTYQGRQNNREAYENYLDQHPLSIHSFNRLIMHLRETFPENITGDVNEILNRGYF